MPPSRHPSDAPHDGVPVPAPPTPTHDAERLLELIGDAYIVLDREYRFVYANRAAQRDMQKSLDEIRGRVHWEVFPASFDITAGQRYRAAAETGVVQHFREHYKYEGYDIHMEMSAYPTDEGGVAVIWRDISDRVKAEAALQERKAQLAASEARLRAVIEAVPVGVFVADMQGRIVIVNRQAEELVGARYMAESVLEFDRYRGYWTDTGTPVAAEDWALARALMRGERSDQERIEIERIDGGIRSILNYAAPIFDADAQQIGAVAAAVDITAQVEAEAARAQSIRDSEARARIAFQDAPVPMWLYDVETLRFLDVDAAAVRQYGYSHDEFLGMTLRDIRPPEEVGRLTALLADTRRGELHHAAVVHRTKDGRHVDVEITTQSTTWDGRPARVVLALDVSERLRAAEALQASEERYAMAARATSHAIWDWNVASGRVTWSEGFSAVFAHPVTSIVETLDWWLAAVHPDDRERVCSRLHALVDDVHGGAEWQDTYRFVRGDGEWAIVLHRGVVARAGDGRAVRMIGAMEDVTATRQLEEQLRQAQKMEAVGQLAGGVAHDFNNLLTVIGGNLEFLRADITAALPATHDAHAEIEEIAQATERARTLVSQLLTFSRRQPVRTQRVRLGAVVDGAQKLLRRVIGEEILLAVEIADGDWFVEADPSQLEQLLMNLAVNGRDAMLTPLHGHPGRGGVLTIDVDTTDTPPRDAALLGGAPPERWVRLRVRDTGHGMDAATQRHVFEPFFTTKAVGLGTGLGLSTVFGAVRAAGGTIRIDSAPGAGTTFTMHFPALPSGDAAFAQRVASTPEAHAATVLLVEDEAPLRTTVRRMLERRGYTVLECRHGGDALLVWREHGEHIDVVVSDVRMPELGGRELVALLRAQRPTLPVVLMSGYSDQEAVVGGMSQSEFVAKPFSGDALLAAIHRVLGPSRSGAGR